MKNSIIIKINSMKTASYFIILLCLLVSSSQAQTKIINTFSIKSSGGWDYLELSPANNWLYVSHSKQVNIIDRTTGDSIGVIENTNGVHGIAFDKENGKGFTSNGKLNSSTVFDINTNNVITQISTGKNPDAISYEPYSKKIITCNGHDSSLSIIDPIKNTVINTVNVEGSPEAAASDGAGKLFVNLEDKNEIVVVDTKTFKTINRFRLFPGTGPTGLVYDKKYNRLFSGCDELLVIMNADNGKIIDKIKIGRGCDGVVFDETHRIIYTSNGEGSISVIKQENADKYNLLPSIKTKKGARTIALDSNTHKLYLPTAEFDPKELNERGRPKMKDGTFQILVVGE
jgi:hypothetical protein